MSGTGRLLCLAVCLLFFLSGSVQAADFSFGATLNHTLAFETIEAYLPTGTFDVRFGDFEIGAAYGRGSTEIDWQETKAEIGLSRIHGSFRYYLGGTDRFSPYIGGRGVILRGDLSGKDGETEVNGEIRGWALGPSAGTKIKISEDWPFNILFSLGYEYADQRVEEETFYTDELQDEDSRGETVHRIFLLGALRITF